MFQEHINFRGSAVEPRYHINQSAITQLEKYTHDVRSWKKTLEFLREENVCLKNCLADILKNEVNTAYVEKAEYFLSKFLDQDDLMKLVNYDIRQYQKLLQNAGTMAAGDVLHLTNKQIRLKMDIEQIEQEYSKLKFSFYNYINEVFSNLKEK